MAEARAIVQNPKDAHEVAASLLRLADAVDHRGQVTFLDDARREEVAKQLRHLADGLDPKGRAVEAWALASLYVRCPHCGELMAVDAIGDVIRCQCQRAWRLGLLAVEDAP